MRALVWGSIALALVAGCATVKDPNTGEDRDLFANFKKNLRANARQATGDVERTTKLKGLTDALNGCPAAQRQTYELDGEQEYSIGRTVAARELADLGVKPLPPDHPASKYVDHVGQLIAVAAEANGEGVLSDRDPNRDESKLPNRPWPLAGYHFIVLDSSDANGFGSPGGVVIITTGMMAKLQSEDELAAVLAHEVVHNQRGHGVEVLKAFMCQTAAKKEAKKSAAELQAKASDLLPGEGLKSSDPEALAKFLDAMSDGAMALLNDGYPTEFELEADRIAVRYMVRAGYDPHAMVNVLQRMQAEAKGQDAYMKTHPPFADRIAAVRPILSSMSPEQLTVAPDALAVRTQRFKGNTTNLPLTPPPPPPPPAAPPPATKS